MVAEVPHTLEYRGGQLNVAPVLENGPYVPMTAGQRKQEVQWTGNERKAVNLDQRLKSLIMSVFLDDQMNFFINCLTAKSTWDDLILYHEGTSDVKESRVMDQKLGYNTFKFKEESELASLFGKLKYEENLIDSIYKSKKEKSLVTATPLSTAFFSTSIVEDFDDSPDDEEDTRRSQRFGSAKATDDTICHKCDKKKPKLRPNKEFEKKYNKVKAKLALLNSGTSSKSSMVKNKGLVAKAYEWDEEDVSLDKNDMTEVKVHMAQTDDENVVVGKESARNGEWVKISMRKVHTLLDKEDNDERKSFLDYLCIDLSYVEEQRNKLMLKHRDLVQELNTCKEQLLVLKQAKLDFLTMQFEQIPSQKKRISGLDQLTEDPSSSGQIDLVFVKSSAEDIKVSISGVERPWLSEAEGFTLPNHNTSTEYDLADESSVCSTPLSPLEKLASVEPVSGPKAIKLILKSNSTFKADTLKGVTINEPSSYPSKGNKNASASKNNLTSIGKLKNVKIEDDSPLTCDHAEYMSTINMTRHLKSQGGSSSISKTSRPSKPFPPFIHYGFNDHLSDDCVNYPIRDNCGSYDHDTHGHNRWFRRGEAHQAKKAKAFQSRKTESSNANRSKTPTKRSINHEKYTLVIVDEYSSILVNFCDEKGISQNFFSPCTSEQNGVAERKNKTLVEAARTMLSRSVFSKQYWTEAVATACYSQNRCPVYIHNHKDYLGKFDEKYDDGYFLGYSLVSKAFRVFNTRRQQTEETYHITFDESTDAIKFTKLSDDNITIAESEIYPPNEYLYPYEPSQRYQVNSNVVSFIDPYERPEPVVLETNTSKPLSSLVEDASVSKIIPIPTNPSLSIPSLASPAPQDRWSQDKHIELVNIIGNPCSRMLIRAMTKELSVASAYECLFIDFLSKEEPKKFSEALKYPRWVDAIEEKLNQFDRNKVWILVLAPHGKTIIRSKWSSEFPNHVRKLDNAFYGLKQALRECENTNGTPNNLRPDLNGKAVNETQYRGMIGSLMYLKGTPSLGLWYPKCSGFVLKRYSDFDYVGCNMDRKSTLAEAEYVAALGYCANILWMKILHSRTKHIDIRYHFIRDHILKGDIKLHFIPTQYQLANIFTKPLDEPTFKRLICELGMLNIDGSKPEPSNDSSDED
ncbi:retrovirus-related pol polyprotein from transposon TNT 1-94 [Tanacetum coccineum]